MSIDHFITLGFLILLQAVLGFDNLLYISIESKRAPADRQAAVRHWGIGIAIALRIALLFFVVQAVEHFREPWFHLDQTDIIEGSFGFHSVTVLIGGAFILYTATKEILHMLQTDLEHEKAGGGTRSVAATIAWIVAMNLVFSFDSILSAMALTDVFWVMATAIVISGLLMIWLADRVSTFLARNRMYEVLGLFILFVVGVMLVTEGGHLAHLKLFGNEITPMTKTTFYFVISVLVLTDLVQSRYQRKLQRQRAQ
ncbi:MAG: TerC family protein [Planctomycetota bacterium]